jgi:hypothetical protein
LDPEAPLRPWCGCSILGAVIPIGIEVGNVEELWKKRNVGGVVAEMEKSGRKKRVRRKEGGISSWDGI